jgi:RNA ligase
MLSTTNSGSNYLAKVVQIRELKKHPNADKLQIAVVEGFEVIVGLNANVGDVGIYFPIESCLSKEILSFTNNFSDPTLNRNPKAKGFFNSSGRVKAVKLRGVVSDGYFMSVDIFSEFLTTFSTQSLTSLQDYVCSSVGVSFDSIDNGTSTLVCEKYVPFNIREKGPANLPKKDKTARFNRLVPGQFHFHIDTPNLRRELDKIHPEDVITITEKLHGTSAVFSNILVKRKLGWKDKIAKFFGVKIQEVDYDVIYSSRSVIKNAYVYDDPQKLEGGGYYKQDIWAIAKEKVKHALSPGISIYAEIVGYLPTGGWIQKNYDYGNSPGQFKVYVYRITSTDVYGNVTEYTTSQIRQHCYKHNLVMVPLHYYGPASEFLRNSSEVSLDEWRKKLLEVLTEKHLERKCGMCNTNVPAEGIVVTVEKPEFSPFKLKARSFLEGETISLDQGVVDIETMESVQ